MDHREIAVRVLAMFSEMGVNVVETEETSEEGAESRDEPDEEGESEGGDLVEVQQKVPAKAETKEPTERTDDPVRMYQEDRMLRRLRRMNPSDWRSRQISAIRGGPLGSDFHL
jgi:hypothetical protein